MYRCVVCQSKDGAEEIEKWVAAVYTQAGLSDQVEELDFTGGSSGSGGSKKATAFVGLDVEWCPLWWRQGRDEKVDTIQLYAPGSPGCLVYSTGDDATLPACLAKLLGDDRVIKLGVNVQGDASRLCRDFGTTVAGLHDIAGNAKVSLQSLCNSRLPDPLHVMKQPDNSDQKPGAKKKAGGVRVSNWAAWPLHVTQVSYAARDAVLSFWAFAYEHGATWVSEAEPPSGVGLKIDLSQLVIQPPTEPASGAAAAAGAFGGSSSGGAFGGGSGGSGSGAFGGGGSGGSGAFGGGGSGGGSGGAFGSGWDDKCGKTKKASGANASFFVMQRNNSIEPPMMGIKEHPEGPADALKGVAAVVSGVLDSMSRDEMYEYIQRHGGKKVSGVTKACTHLLNDLGEVGPAKQAKCLKLNVPICSEDVIFQKVAAAAAKCSPEQQAEFKERERERAANPFAAAPKPVKEKAVKRNLADHDHDVNSAPLSLLSELKGFSAALVDALVEGRPFRSEADAKKRTRGLGAIKLAILKANGLEFPQRASKKAKKS